MTPTKPLSAAEQMREDAVAACRDRANYWTGAERTVKRVEANALSRIIAALPIPADPVRTALVEALRDAKSVILEAMEALIGQDVCVTDDGSDALHQANLKISAALALAGETP